MRIAWFSNIDFQEGNAANSRIRALANGLKKNGNQVFLFLLRPSIFNSNQINKKQRGFFDGIYFNYLNGSVIRYNHFLRRFISYITSLITSSYLIIKKRRHFDIIFIYQPRFIFFGHIYILAKLFKIPVIVEKTEIDESAKSQKPFNRLLNKINKMDAFTFKYFIDHVFVISEGIKKHTEQFFPKNNITLIPIIVDNNRFNKMNYKANKTIGYLGSFGEKDGIPGIIIAFKKSLEKLPELKLKLIGFNEFETHTDLELKKNQLNGQVEQSGQITYDEVPKWLAKCDLLIMNRTNHPFSHYGFPTKLGEYLATGIPTICTKVGDIEKYLDHQVNSYLIEPDNTNELEKAIANRYQNYEQFNEMGQRGKLVAQTQFDYQRYIPVIQSVMEEIVSKNKR